MIIATECEVCKKDLSYDTEIELCLQNIVVLGPHKKSKTLYEIVCQDCVDQLTIYQIENSNFGVNCDIVKKAMEKDPIPKVIW